VLIIYIHKDLKEKVLILNYPYLQDVSVHQHCMQHIETSCYSVKYQQLLSEYTGY